jgi:hypothetical protein
VDLDPKLLDELARVYKDAALRQLLRELDEQASKEPSSNINNGGNTVKHHAEKDATRLP